MGRFNLLTRIKKHVEAWLRGFAQRLTLIGITPDAMSIAGLVLSIIAAYFYAFASAPWTFWLAAAILAVSGLCDALDGLIARLSKRVTPFGSFLDSMLDRYSDSAVIIGITLYSAGNNILSIPALFWGLLALTGSLLVSYARAKAESLNVPLASIGIAERPERILIIIIFSLILHPEWGLVALAILTNLTVAQRIVYVKRRLRLKAQ